MTYFTKNDRSFYIVRAVLKARMHAEHISAKAFYAAQVAALDALEHGCSRARAVRIGYQRMHAAVVS